MKKYQNYTLAEKIEIIKNCSIPDAPDFYLRLNYGFDRSDVENEQLRNLVLQNTNTLQNVVKETILEMNRVGTKNVDVASFDDLLVNHAKKAISKRKKVI